MSTTNAASRLPASASSRPERAAAATPRRSFGAGTLRARLGVARGLRHEGRLRSRKHREGPASARCLGLGSHHRHRLRVGLQHLARRVDQALAVGRERAAAAVAEAGRQRHRGAARGAHRLRRAARLRDLRAALAAEEVAAPVDRLAGRALERRRRGVRQHLAADGLDRLLAVEQPHAADRHQVAVAERALGDAVAVHHRAVRRAAVAQEELAPAVLDDGVAPRDHRVGQHEVVGRIAPDRQDRRARERDLAPVRRRRVDDQLRHALRLPGRSGGSSSPP